MGDRNKGLFGKFKVYRTDGMDCIGKKHEGCEYFVLDLNHDPHAIPAVLAYAGSCERDGYGKLAADLRNRIGYITDPSVPTRDGGAVPSTGSVNETASAGRTTDSTPATPLTKGPGPSAAGEREEFEGLLIELCRAQDELSTSAKDGDEIDNATSYVENVKADLRTAWQAASRRAVEPDYESAEKALAATLDEIEPFDPDNETPSWEPKWLARQARAIVDAALRRGGGR